MKINKQSHQLFSAKIAIIIGTILVVALLAMFIYDRFFTLPSRQSPSTTTKESATQQPADTSSNTKENTSSTESNKTTNQVPINQSLTASFINLVQSEGYIKFSGSANNSLTGGTCSIVFVNPNDRPISRTVSAIPDGENSVCDPVKIPETEFSFLGEWTATFRYYINGSQAVAERKITIK